MCGKQGVPLYERTGHGGEAGVWNVEVPVGSGWDLHLEVLWFWLCVSWGQTRVAQAGARRGGGCVWKSVQSTGSGELVSGVPLALPARGARGPRCVCAARPDRRRVCRVRVAVGSRGDTGGNPLFRP